MADSPDKRDKTFNVRMSKDLYRAALAKARALGGLSAVIRVLLRKFVAGEVVIQREEMLDELLPAPRDVPPRRPRPKSDKG